eukprot:1760456-Lingulodinium_polyedra.AAC.1
MARGQVQPYRCKATAWCVPASVCMMPGMVGRFKHDGAQWAQGLEQIVPVCVQSWANGLKLIALVCVRCWVYGMKHIAPLCVR